MSKAVVISVVLAAAAEPIHEAGHAVAVKLFTGKWPRITLWAVFPPAIQSSEAAMAILACRRSRRSVVVAVRNDLRA